MNQTTVAHYLAGRIADAGVRHVFMVTGGGAMFLNDAFAFQDRLAPCSATTNRPARWPPKLCAHHRRPRHDQRHHRPRAASTRSTASSAPGPTRFPCWSSPARSSAPPASPPRLCRACASWATRKARSSRWRAASPSTRRRRRAEDIAWHLDQALHLATTAGPGRSGWTSHRRAERASTRQRCAAGRRQPAPPLVPPNPRSTR
jgi:hypothetical protein